MILALQGSFEELIPAMKTLGATVEKASSGGSESGYLKSDISAVQRAVPGHSVMVTDGHWGSGDSEKVTPDHCCHY